MAASSTSVAVLGVAAAGGLLVRQLRNLLVGSPPVDECDIMPLTHAFEAPPPFQPLAPLLLPPGAALTPELRVPASPANVAAWVAGALTARAVVLLACWLARGSQSHSTMHARRVHGRIEITSDWRDRDDGDKDDHRVVVRGSPGRCAKNALAAMLRKREQHSVAIVVVNR